LAHASADGDDDIVSFSVEMFFDGAADARVRSIWRRLAEAGLPSLREGRDTPHVSLAVCGKLAPERLAPGLAAFAAGERAPRVALATVSTFPTAEGVLFLGAVVTRALLELHARGFAVFGRVAESPWDYYRPGRWVPHCTLALGLAGAQLAEAIQIGAGLELPIEATLESVAIVENPAGVVHARFPFQRGPA
jgi:hypothetical protein